MGVKRGRGDRVSSEATYHKTLGSPQLTPAKFRRQLKTTTLSGPAPADYRFPSNLTGDQVFVDLRQNPSQYEGATLQTIEEQLLATDALRSYRRTEEAQTETIDERLVQETDPPPPLSALVTTMKQEALGDGKAQLVLGTVTYVFPNQKWEVNRPSVIPSEFTALIPNQEYTFTEAGIAGPIPLPLAFGTLSASDEQIDVYRHRLKSGVQDLAGLLPVTITGSRTTKDKQVEHIEKTLEIDTTTPAPPTAVLDVTFTKLGGGVAIEEHDFVDELFTEEKFEKEITDVVPHRFKALLPVQTQSSVTEGIAAPPVMIDGDLKRTSEQTNVFVVKNSRQFRDVTLLPVQQTDYKLTGKLQVSLVTNRLAVGLQTLEPDYTWIDGDVQDLGNNTSIRSVQAVAPADFFEERSYEAQIPDLLPEKFRPLALTRKESLLIPGIATQPPDPLPTGYLSAKSEQENAFVTRLSTTFRDVTGLPVSLTDYELTREKQISTVIGTLATGLQTLTGISALTEKAQVDNLGNNTSLKIIGTVPILFEAESYSKSIPDALPEKFRVVAPTTKHEILFEATGATNRVLIPGELAYSSEQINAFVTKESSTYRSTAGLPVSLPSYRMTQQQQVANVLATLATGLQTIVPTALHIEAEVDNLGNGTSLKTESTVDFVFPDDSYTKSVLNLIPEKLRAKIPLLESTIESEIPPNVSTNPTLLAGEFERTEKRIALWKKRVTTKKIDLTGLTLPLTVEEKGFTEEFGGDTTTTTHTLRVAGLLVVETGLLILKSEVISLENGYEVRSTTKADTGWTTIFGTHVDEKYAIKINLERTTVAAGTTGGSASDGEIITEVRARDRWKSIQIVSRLDPSSLPPPKVWYAGMQHSFPPELQVGTVIDWAQAVCECSSSFSAILIANMKQYSGSVDTKITEEFFRGPPPDDCHATKFHPEAHNFGYAWASYCGTSDGDCRTKSGAPEFYIPLCLHDTFSVSIGAFRVWSFGATDPAMLPHGTYIMMPPHVERWRFNVFRRVKTEIMVP